MREFFWIRHFPIDNKGKYIGQTDIAEITSLPIKNIALPTNAIWFSSTLTRAIKTAHLFMVEYGIETNKLNIEPALMEQNFGDWEGKTYDEIWSKEEKLHNWQKPETIKPPNGERFIELYERVENWIKKQDQQQPTIIVTHSGVIRAATKYFNKLSYADCLTLNIGFGEINYLHTPIS